MIRVYHEAKKAYNAKAAWLLCGNGGTYRDRTDDLKLAKLLLSQLS
jgi:hypothetical protein